MWQVTHRVHLPTMALGLLWIVHSVATTLYVPWQNYHQRAALKSLQTAVEATLQIQEKLSDLQSGSRDSGSSENEYRLHKELSQAILELQQQLKDPQSYALLSKLESHVQAWQTGQRQSGQLVTLRELIVDCQQLIRSEQTMLLEVVDQRSRTDVLVMVVRGILLILGLAVGLGLAMWMARELKESLFQISVSLRSAEGQAHTDLGHIELVSKNHPGELVTLETQVANVVQNLRNVAAELHQTRQEMARAERLAAVGEVAAGVAHEIRNPLTSVKLLIQRAAERKPIHSLNEEQLQVLLEEVSRIENTVQGLLDFARPEKPRRVDCLLSDVVSRTIKLLDGRLQQNRIQVVLPERQSALKLNCDPHLIKQVLVNIAINAIDSMPEGGALMVREYLDETHGSAIVEFEDTGPGIDPSVAERLFEPFVTTRAKGSGLGLAISKRIVEEHGGTLLAINVSTGGALFKMSLPQSRRAVEERTNGEIAGN